VGVLVRWLLEWYAAKGSGGHDMINDGPYRTVHADKRVSQRFDIENTRLKEVPFDYSQRCETGPDIEAPSDAD